MSARPWTRLTLVSHVLCPYVQRVAITLAEKGIAFDRIDIDLANKPAWFLALSPTGRTPLLLVDDAPIFESSVICEYLEDVAWPQLHSADPLVRARERAWVQLASELLDAIGALYNAPDEATLDQKQARIRERFEQLERALQQRAPDDDPYFDGERFSLVDAAFAPALRYFDVIDDAGFDLFRGLPKLSAWRAALAARRSVRTAAHPDYHARLHAFLLARPSALAARLRQHSVPAIAAFS